MRSTIDCDIINAISVVLITLHKEEIMDINDIINKDPDTLTQDEITVLTMHLFDKISNKIDAQSKTIEIQNKRLIESFDNFKLYDKVITELQKAVIELRGQLDVIKSSGESMGMYKETASGILLR